MPQPISAAEVGPKAEFLLKARFRHAGVSYPPELLQLIALKETKRLELWVWADRKWRHIHDYPVLAASGDAGPKLREGDKQVPEGFYRISALNPNSQFHLSLKLDYPNPFDWQHAIEEGRKSPGSNIFIHGSAWSVGCLAIGNQNVEELYGLVSEVGPERVQVMVIPYDFRTRDYSITQDDPPWLERLYGYLNLRVRQFPLAAKRRGCSVECLMHQATHKPLR
ncbi:MAG: L,D-transpeptidase family protein [Chromatiales bacterium]